MAKKKKISAGDYEERNNNEKKNKTTAREVIPEDLVMDNILTRLPFRSLARFSSVSKNWHRSILNNARFTALHFANQKNNRKIVLSLFDISEHISEQLCEESFCLLELQQKTNDNKTVFADYKLLQTSYYPEPNELVGYCNGLFCVIALNRGDEEYGVVTVYNPALMESVTLNYLNPIEARGEEYLCHGFGFDSLSKLYKIAVIYTTTIEAEEVFVCMVYTSEEAEWKKIVTRTSEISPPPQPDSSSCQLPKRRSVTRALGENCRSATLCGGDLYWRINKSLVMNDDDDDYADDADDDNQEEMLLSFDINSENIQFIRLPTECSTTMERTPSQPDLVVDHHLLEFKGYPCVAISEKTMKSNRDRRSHHPRRRFHSCHFGVQMYVLKDKAKQVWTREEIFNVTFEDTVLSPLPRPFSRCCFENITATTPPTRILSFSNQVFLYWFDGESLVYYSFKMNGLKVAKGSLSSDDKKIQEIFEAKMKRISSGRNIHFPYMEYQLHAQMENIFSLKTFIPQGGGTIYEDPDNFTDFLDSFSDSEDNKPAGWLTTTRNNSEINEVFY